MFTFASEMGRQPIKAGSGTCLQDNRAVGNSRLTHMDVLSVSCKQVPEPDRWHSVDLEQCSPLQQAKKRRSMSAVLLIAGKSLNEGSIVFGNCLHAQADATLLVDFQNLDLDRLAFGNHVGDIFHPLV